MVKVKQSICTFVLSLFVLLTLSLPAWAEEQVVFDQAGLLTDEEKTELEDKVYTLEEKTGWEIFLVTTDTYSGKSTMAYADDFFDERTKEEDSGFVLLIDMYYRELYISTAGETIACFNDSRIEDILDEGYYYITDGEYARCLEAMLDEAEYYFDRGIPDNQEIYDTETGKTTYYRKLTIGEILFSLAVGAGAALIIFLGVTGKYRLKVNTYQYDYRKNGKLDLTLKNDQFINRTVTNRVIPRNTGGGGGGGSRSSTHHSSSGRSHGGGGRKF